MPIDAGLTVESPLMPKVSGQAAMDYLKRVSDGLKEIEIRQHIVEGDWVATLLDEDTVNGALTVFAKFQVVSGRIRDVSVFYDPRRILQGSE